VKLVVESAQVCVFGLLFGENTSLYTSLKELFNPSPQGQPPQTANPFSFISAYNNSVPPPYFGIQSILL
jgi:hypothetical protein